jgi:6-methylsalicylate decarboxylase
MNRLSADEPVIDVHQHVWTDALIEALRARRAPPRMRGWTLELAGEPDYDVDPAAHDPDARAALARDDGVDLALVSLSSPLGIESLAPDEAIELIAAYHEGALTLPEPFGAWAAACLTEVDAGALAKELERGFVGLQLPATSLLDGAGYEHVGSLLEVLEEAGLPLLVHPGPAAGGAPVAGSGPGAGDAPVARGGPVAGSGPVAGNQPTWWPAIVTYVQQMHAAWFAFRVHGRPRHPRLRVCFAMLAGLAQLHSERVAARAGDRSVVDADVFLDVSSYGTRAVDATVRVLGIDALVNGSDRPYADPAKLELGPAALHAIRSANALRLLYPKEVFDDLAIASPA